MDADEEDDEEEEEIELDANFREEEDDEEDDDDDEEDEDDDDDVDDVDEVSVVPAKISLKKTNTESEAKKENKKMLDHIALKHLADNYLRAHQAASSKKYEILSAVNEQLDNFQHEPQDASDSIMHKYSTMREHMHNNNGDKPTLNMRKSNKNAFQSVLSNLPSWGERDELNGVHAINALQKSLSDQDDDFVEEVGELPPTKMSLRKNPNNKHHSKKLAKSEEKFLKTSKFVAKS